MLETENMYTLYSIEAWRYAGEGWSYNNMFKIEEDVYLAPEVVDSPRRLLAFMRRAGWLSEEGSKGILEVEDTGFDVEIRLRGTKEPLLTFRPQWPM